MSTTVLKRLREEHICEGHICNFDGLMREAADLIEAGNLSVDDLIDLRNRREIAQQPGCICPPTSEQTDIQRQEAESLADAKKRLLKRSGAEPMTNPRDDGEAVAQEAAKRMLQTYAVTGDEWFKRAADSIATLSRQLAEAQGVIERQSNVTDEMVDAALNAWFSGSQSETDQGLERSMRAAIVAALRKP